MKKSLLETKSLISKNQQKTMMISDEGIQENSEDNEQDFEEEIEDIEVDSLEDYKNYNKKVTKLINNNIFSSSLNPKLFEGKT